MSRKPKTLDSYDIGEGVIDESQFNNSVANGRVDFKCECGKIVESKKRLITARLNAGKSLLCDSCKNRKNVSNRYS